MILGRVEFFYRRRRYQIKEFLKNIGSNFILKDKKFDFEPKILPRSELCSTTGVGWQASNNIFRLAEGVGFYPV